MVVKSSEYGIGVEVAAETAEAVETPVEMRSNMTGKAPKEGERTCLQNIIGVFVFGFYAIVIFLFGAVYAGACKWTPIVILPLLFFVFASGFAAARVYRRFEMSKTVFLFVGIAIGCVAIYGNWFWFVRFLTGAAEWNPLKQSGHIHEIAEIRKISLNGVLPLTSGALSLCYFLETVIVVGMTLVVSYLLDNRCCKNCLNWETRLICRDTYMTVGELKDLLMRMINDEGRFSVLELLIALMGEDQELRHIQFRVKYCPKCQKGEVSVSELVKDGDDIKEVELSGLAELHLDKTQLALNALTEACVSGGGEAPCDVV